MQAVNRSSHAEIAASAQAMIISRILADDCPTKIVLIGQGAKGLLESALVPAQCQHFDSIDACAANPAAQRDADLALLWIESEEPNLDRVLGLSCRLYPQRLLVKVSVREPVIPAARFFAFGFRRLAQSAMENLAGQAPPDRLVSKSSKDGLVKNEPFSLALNQDGLFGDWPIIYEYQLAEYKRVPDWLNAKYWANPERFDVLEPEYDDAGKPLCPGKQQISVQDHEPEESE